MSFQIGGGTQPSKYRCYSKRAGQFHLYCIYMRIYSKECQDVMRIVFIGILCTIAQEVQNGNERITIGMKSAGGYQRTKQNQDDVLTYFKFCPGTWTEA